MKIDTLIKYNIWANKIYLEYCEELSENDFNEKLLNFEKSIRSIIQHLFNTNRFWLSYLRREDPVLNDDTEYNKSELISGLKQSNNELLEYTQKHSLSEVYNLSFEGNIDRSIETTSENILTNLVTHSIYHRGQIALLLRQLGYEQIKPTDFNPYTLSNYRNGKLIH